MSKFSKFSAPCIKYVHCLDIISASLHLSSLNIYSLAILMCASMFGYIYMIVICMHEHKHTHTHLTNGIQKAFLKPTLKNKKPPYTASPSNHEYETILHV